jgi:methyl-accepting chemotaxis protein
MRRIVRGVRDLRIRTKLLSSFVTIAVVAALVGVVGLLALGSMQNRVDQISTNMTPSMVAILRTQNAVYQCNALTKQAEGYSSADLLAAVSPPWQQSRQTAADQFSRFQKLVVDDPQVATLTARTAKEMTAWAKMGVALYAYAHGNTDNGLNSDTMNLFFSGEPLPGAQQLSDDLDHLATLRQQSVDANAAAARASRQTISTILLGAIAAAVVLAIALGLAITRAIAGPLDEVRRSAVAVADIDIRNLAITMTALKDADLTVPVLVSAEPPRYRSADETGRTAEAMRTIIARAREAATAYEQARIALVELVGEVKRSSTAVATGAQALSDTTDQIGTATSQIARVIEDVARGASGQSQSACAAADQMSRFGVTVGEVAQGADAQQQASVSADEAIARLTEVLAQVTARVVSVTASAEHAATTATEGGVAVRQTVASISKAREAVARSAEQVHALGQRSKEVGQIVEAIDDIASQTNLLALNAAIEAARAGEHGKGFTVVAAEVRKLAERASSETHEIGRRIAAIQDQVKQVVAAMEASDAEVGQSAQLGQQAGAALAGILGVVEETSRQARDIGTAIGDMGTSVEQVNVAARRMASVAENTKLSARQMQDGSTQISNAIEDISAISEESAASMEEVSASTQEQSASVQILGTEAQALTIVAASLSNLVGRFTVEALEPVAEPTSAQDRSRRPSRSA